jgi:hypothetical protein
MICDSLLVAADGDRNNEPNAPMITTASRPSKALFTPLFPATPDSIGFFEAVLGFGQLAGQWIRISAADQRRYFGCVPFGKMAIKVEEGGEITTFKTQAFGQDWDFGTWFFDHSRKVWTNGHDRKEFHSFPCLA